MLRRGPFSPVDTCFSGSLNCLYDLGASVNKSKQKPIDQKKAIGGFRRSGIIDVVLQHLMLMAKNWESEERKMASVARIERSLLSIALVFVGAVSPQHPLVDEEEATKIVSTLYEVSMFHFDRDSDCAFPTFIFFETVGFAVVSFPTLPLPDIGERMLQSLLPRKKLCYKKGGFERSITAPCSSGAWTVEERLRNDCTIHSPTRSNCHPVPYCSNRCQEQHWHQHRRDCVKVNEFKQWLMEKTPLAQVGCTARCPRSGTTLWRCAWALAGGPQL